MTARGPVSYTLYATCLEVASACHSRFVRFPNHFVTAESGTNPTKKSWKQHAGRPPTGCPCLLAFVLPTLTGLTARSLRMASLPRQSQVLSRYFLAYPANPARRQPPVSATPTGCSSGCPATPCLSVELADEIRCATLVVLRPSLTVAPRNLNAYRPRDRRGCSQRLAPARAATRTARKCLQSVREAFPFCGN